MMQCQAKGVKVILSMGGAVGNYGFSSAADATAYAPTVSCGSLIPFLILCEYQWRGSRFLVAFFVIIDEDTC